MAVQTSQITTASGALSIVPAGGSAVNITGEATTSVSTNNNSGNKVLVTKDYLDGFTSKFPDWSDGKGNVFEDRYVNRVGDTMTGTLNVGTNKIELNINGLIKTTNKVETPRIVTGSGVLTLAPAGGNVAITGSATSSTSTTNSSDAQTLVTKNYLDTFTSKYPDWTDGNGNNFDNRYVLKAGDTMTGNLNVGTNKITLAAGTGHITTTGNIQAANYRIDTLPTLP